MTGSLSDSTDERTQLSRRIHVWPDLEYEVCGVWAAHTHYKGTHQGRIQASVSMRFTQGTVEIRKTRSSLFW
jgi:hypothetical protein